MFIENAKKEKLINIILAVMFLLWAVFFHFYGDFSIFGYEVTADVQHWCVAACAIICLLNVFEVFTVQSAKEES